MKSRVLSSAGVCACLVVTVLAAGIARAQNQLADMDRVVTHENTKPAGELQNGVLTIHLTFKPGAWHPDAEDGQGVPALTITEEGQAPSIPGPLIRVAEGTRIHAYIKNPLFYPMVMHGLHQRPGDAKDTLTVPPGQTKEVNFLAGAPGTYFYWATTFADVPLDARPTTDTQMTGAFVVDAPGAPTDDKIMMLGLWYAWMIPFDFSHDHGFHEILTVNGKSFPHTQRLTYTVGDTARWRVINATVAAHPMHLHGAFFRVDSAGDGEKDTIYKPEQQRTVVTELMPPGRTMAVDWTPLNAGNWIFHCHIAAHMDPMIAQQAAAAMGTEHQGHDAHAGHENGMAGLVVGITVKPREGAVAEVAKTPARKLTLMIEPPAKSGGAIRLQLRDGESVTSTADGAEVGPPIVLHRGEPTEITVVNHLAGATAIHWHGIELESYYDGVPQYGGNSRQVTPPIAAGTSFVARMTPPRAGTFIYHTHWHDMTQLTSGLYGALIVLAPGQKYDPEHDRAYVVGRGAGGFFKGPLLVNGVSSPTEQTMRRGEKYRLRFINITPNDDDVELKLIRGEAAVHWRPVAKDGADLPDSQANACEAKQAFAPGETYDFEIVPETAGDLKLAMHFLDQTPTVPIRVVNAAVLTRK